jgi:hypothetical protein
MEGPATDALASSNTTSLQKDRQCQLACLSCSASTILAGITDGEEPFPDIEWFEDDDSTMEVGIILEAKSFMNQFTHGKFLVRSGAICDELCKLATSEANVNLYPPDCMIYTVVQSYPSDQMEK